MKLNQSKFIVMETSMSGAATAAAPETTLSSPEIPCQGRGKIAALDRHTREELNRRLDNGQQAPEILPWLNGLPQVKEKLRIHFNDVPISPQNLSAWRRGGFQFWLWQQQLLENSHLMRDSVEHMQESLQYDCSRERPGLLVDDLLSQFTSQVASFMLHSSGAPNDQQWPAFMKVGNFLIKLQNACHRAEREAVERPARLRKAEEDEECQVRMEIREEMRQEELEEAAAKKQKEAKAKKARKKTRSSPVKANQGSDPKPAKPAIVKNVDFTKEAPPADSASTV
jgi:hypothetical protein